MTTFDVHTDKAIKELRARLDQAERERDEARAVLAKAELEARDHSRAIEDTLPEVRALREASRTEPARIAAAEMARDLRWLVAMRECGFKIAQVAKLALDGVSDAGAAKIAEAATWGDDIAAAIRAARGAL